MKGTKNDEALTALRHRVSVSQAGVHQQYDREPLPSGMAKWYGSYSYPGSQVLVFDQREVGHIGFCRLNPDFPGCSPLELWHQDVRLSEILVLLNDRLIPNKRKPKLTFSDAKLAARSEEEGYRLNYKLFEMSLDRKSA